MFSYGKDNVVYFDKNKITQLTAPNGSGKSSIALVLQETLFNKNIKNIKKSDILNRHCKEKTWSSCLEFYVDQVFYEIEVKRTGAQTKVVLKQDSVDISDHKVLDTYKKLHQILNLNFDIFSQLTYQSSVDLLDFLKATDTNRKKFLINLFNLEKYVNIGETVKLKSSSVEKEHSIKQGELRSIEQFLSSVEIPSLLEEKEVPEIDETLQQQIGILQQELNNYQTICKNIDKNNLYISERDSLVFDLNLKKPEFFSSLSDYTETKKQVNNIDSNIKRLKRECDSLDTAEHCYACGQPLDVSHAKELQTRLLQEIDSLKLEQQTLIEQISEWDKELSQIKKEKQAYENNQKIIERFEQLTQLINTEIPTEYPDIPNIKEKIAELEQKYLIQKQNSNKIIEFNKQVGINNAKVSALEEQKDDFLNRQKDIKKDNISLSSSINNLSILKKAFSTSGIVAFKLENLTKELESSINYYLSLLSDGQFQVEFILDKEKLNIVVINNGLSTPIETVSGGEFSRIQTAILLAIRNLLSKLGGSSINLLFLDEITGVLDDEGKEKLIEVLTEETFLNVFLISHDFTHPLINKVEIAKKDNISSIQG